MNNLQLNDRVEYAVKINGERKHCVGYVKRIFRKWFTVYVEICESRTRRVDCVRLKDIFGKVERKTFNKQNHYGIKSKSYSNSAD